MEGGPWAPGSLPELGTGPEYLCSLIAKRERSHHKVPISVSCICEVSFPLHLGTSVIHTILYFCLFGGTFPMVPRACFCLWDQGSLLRGLGCYRNAGVYSGSDTYKPGTISTLLYIAQAPHTIFKWKEAPSCSCKDSTKGTDHEKGTDRLAGDSHTILRALPSTIPVPVALC